MQLNVYKTLYFFHYRDGRWAARPEEFPMKEYPAFMNGILHVLSMSTVRQLAIHCPYHCIAQDHLSYDENGNQSCFWKFEDVFIGSCVKFTQRNALFLYFENSRFFLWRHSTEKEKIHQFFSEKNGLVVNNVKKPKDFEAIQHFLTS